MRQNSFTSEKYLYTLCFKELLHHCKEITHQKTCDSSCSSYKFTEIWDRYIIVTANTVYKTIWQVQYCVSTKQPLPTSSSDPTPPVLGVQAPPPPLILLVLGVQLASDTLAPLAIEQLPPPSHGQGHSLFWMKSLGQGATLFSPYQGFSCTRYASLRHR